MGKIQRILVVEDDPWVRDTTAGIIEFLDYQCAVVNDALDALRVMEIGGFDLVISDITMPGMDGFELLRQIRIRWPGVPVILVSGYYNKVKKAQTLPRLPVLAKPYSIDALQGAIHLAKKYVGVVVPPQAPINGRELEDELRHGSE